MALEKIGEKGKLLICIKEKEVGGICMKKELPYWEYNGRWEDKGWHLLMISRQKYCMRVWKRTLGIEWSWGTS